jgi:hypothetical protein
MNLLELQVLAVVSRIPDGNGALSADDGGVAPPSADTRSATIAEPPAELRAGTKPAA